jgi:hypothetical protein
MISAFMVQKVSQEVTGSSDMGHRSVKDTREAHGGGSSSTWDWEVFLEEVTSKQK